MLQGRRENTIYLDDIDSVVPSKATTVDQMDDPSLTDPKIDQEKIIKGKTDDGRCVYFLHS